MKSTSMRSSLSSLLAVLLLGSTPAVAAFFFQNLNQPKTAAASPQSDQAIQIFSSKFPFDRPPLQPNQFLSLGMPNNYTPNKTVVDRGKRLSDISEVEARATFGELARLYGADAALTMTKAKPIVLSFKVR